MNLDHLINCFEIYKFDAVLHNATRHLRLETSQRSNTIDREFRDVPDESPDVAESSCEVIIATVYIVTACTVGPDSRQMEET
jgi:hypothetical protein